MITEIQSSAQMLEIKAEKQARAEGWSKAPVRDPLGLRTHGLRPPAAVQKGPRPNKEGPIPGCALESLGKLFKTPTLSHIPDQLSQDCWGSDQ